ncbi:MAG: transcriptional regulator [Bryobacteraceae bacterium]|jgi:HTH-type transcriptional regulator/antitoxin HigA
MPVSAYEQLLVGVLPARIETDAQYDTIRTRFGDLLRQARRSKAEERLMDLLGVLIEDFDRRNSLPPDDGTPAERLRFLMEHSARSSSDLLPVFGQRSHVNEALNGKRPISIEQARRLGKMFSMSPGLFI